MRYKNLILLLISFVLISCSRQNPEASSHTTNVPDLPTAEPITFGSVADDHNASTESQDGLNIVIDPDEQEELDDLTADLEELYRNAVPSPLINQYPYHLSNPADTPPNKMTIYIVAEKDEIWEEIAHVCQTLFEEPVKYCRFQPRFVPGMEVIYQGQSLGTTNGEPRGVSLQVPTETGQAILDDITGHFSFNLPEGERIIGTHVHEFASKGAYIAYVYVTLEHCCVPKVTVDCQYENGHVDIIVKSTVFDIYVPDGFCRDPKINGFGKILIITHFPSDRDTVTVTWLQNLADGVRTLNSANPSMELPGDVTGIEITRSN